MKSRIRLIRKNLRMSQTNFGSDLGVSRDVIASYENGRVVPTDTFIQLLCSKYSINETWLRTGEGEMFVQVPKNEALDRQIREFLQGGSDSFRERLISLLIRLPSEHWETLERYARELVDARAVSTSVLAQNEKAPEEPELQKDVLAELAELKRQNQELAAEIAAMKEKDSHIDDDELRSILSTAYGQS